MHKSYKWKKILYILEEMFGSGEMHRDKKFHTHPITINK
jgi:hypothetical protein